CQPVVPREPSSIAQQASPGQAFAGRTDIDPEVVCQQIRVARLWRMRPAPFRTYHECANSPCGATLCVDTKVEDVRWTPRPHDVRGPAAPPAPRRSRNLGLSTWACHVRPKRQLPPRPSSRQVNGIQAPLIAPYCSLLGGVKGAGLVADLVDLLEAIALDG